MEVWKKNFDKGINISSENIILVNQLGDLITGFLFMSLNNCGKNDCYALKKAYHKE